MQPSSLVFLVIIAIWAAYFIQHWVRRREHLATARSVDRFSESMRVLEHRAALPVADLSAPQPRSYAVSPARPARPEILVKRAGRAPEASAAPAASSAGGSAPVPASASAPTSTRDLSGLTSRRARGLTLLGSLTALLVTLGLAAFGIVPWLAVLAPVAAVAGALGWVRSGVKAAQAARRAARTAPVGAAAGRGAGTRRTPASTQAARAPKTHLERTSRPVAPSAPAESPFSILSAPADAEQGEPEPVECEPVVARESFYDLEAVERGAVPAGPVREQSVAVAELVPTAPLVDEDDIPLTWDPVPVPRPTYTMKAVASRTPLPPVAQGVPPELAEPAYEEPERRVAGA